MNNDDLNQTDSFRLDDGGQSAQEELRQLVHLADQSIAMLRTQQDLLRQQGMNVPSSVMSAANAVAMTLTGLTTAISGSQIELRQLRALAETTALMTSTLDVNDVLNNVIDTVISLTGAERGFVMLKDETGKLDVRVARDFDRATLDSSEFSVSSTIINQVVETGEAVLTDNAGDDPRFHQQHSIMRGAFRSILAVPLYAGSEVIGVVYCDNRILAGVFNQYELNLLRAFADQAAVALQNARLFDAVRAQLGEIARIRDLMANVFASIISGVITLDLQANILSLNAAAEQMIGVTAAQVTGVSLWQVLNTPDAAFREKLAHVQSARTVERLDTQIDIVSLGQRDWKITMSPLQNTDGTLQGVAMVLDDLTELKRREEQLTTVRRYLPLALVDNIRSVDLAGFGGQEREITAFFADVRGFTEFGERLEPELLMQIINRYLGAASDAINRYQGVVDKYIGDAVTGLFNTPLNPQLDHARRAVRAALRTIRAVSALHEHLDAPFHLQFGIGIHTGNAILGNVGSAERREFAAIGDAIDTSKWLQEIAQPGEILLSEATYTLVEDDFICESVPPRAGAAPDEWPAVYRVTRRKRHTSSMPAVHVD
ncbi:MAG: GAF domain-containing protein [Anaerolineae bacterium]|nr:GAF domain-containing protein [Anaerolineae bacterium]